MPLMSSPLLIGGGPLGSAALRSLLADAIANNRSPGFGWPGADGGYGDIYTGNTIGGTSSGASYTGSAYTNATSQGGTIGGSIAMSSGWYAPRAAYWYDGNTNQAGESCTTCVTSNNETLGRSGINTRIYSATLYPDAYYGHPTDVASWHYLEGYNGGWITLGSLYRGAGDKSVSTIYSSDTSTVFSDVRLRFAPVGAVANRVAELVFTAATLSNMILQSPAVTVPAAAEVEMMVLWQPIDSAAVNADFTAAINGGAGWSTVSLADIGADLSGHRCLYGRVSGGFGTSLLYRLSTYNAKRQQVRGIFWRPC